MYLRIFSTYIEIYFRDIFLKIKTTNLAAFVAAAATFWNTTDAGVDSDVNSDASSNVGSDAQLQAALGRRLLLRCLVPRRVSVRPATGRQNAKTKRNFKIILSLISKEFRIYISNIAVKVSATRRRSWDSCNLHNFSNSCSLYNLSKIYLQSAVALAAAAAASPAAMQVFDNNMVSRQTCVTYIGHTKIDMYIYISMGYLL